MPKFSLKSLQRLSTCDNNLQALFHEIIKEVDCTVICGHRTEEEQNTAFKSGNSKLKWPDSKHNTMPSLAVDVVPFPIEWGNIPKFKAFAKIVHQKAQEMGIKVEHGGDWVKFPDWPHWQIED